MEHPPSFQIYDASAGSGKTYTLVKEYLKRLLSSQHSGYYKHILAITFTNKAVAEMKVRIVKALKSFSEEHASETENNMLTDLVTETGLSHEEITRRSARILKHLLHHYAMFSVETIDHFNHRLLRTFARDLKLPPHFEVSLDTPQLIGEAVDALIERAGSDPEITQILLDFALEKTDDDTSWDISRDIASIAGLLASENDAPHIKSLSTKSLSQFKQLKALLFSKRKEAQEQTTRIASDILELLTKHQLEESHFSRGHLPKYFARLASADYSVSFGLKWQNELGETPMYPGRVSDDTAATIDSISDELISGFQETKELLSKVRFYEAAAKNVVPLSVIHLVGQELERIKEEQNILPIAQFNSLIYEELKDQPAPYIYERLGERYRHFFIDEFQDTSLLQWNNLLPLTDNARSQEYEDGQPGSLTLVGDAKQAIYRWRGGLPELFLTLSGNASENEIRVNQLQKNFRSQKEIVSFNNSFFSHVSNYFGDDIHTELYRSGNDQQSVATSGGYVNLQFGAFKTKDDANAFYSEKVLQTIQSLLSEGYSEEDICILTRTRKDGMTMSSHLLAHGIPVVSSETLLLSQSPVVNFLVNLLSWSLYSYKEEFLLSLLNFLYEHLSVQDEKHRFLKNHLTSDPDVFSKGMEAFSVDFSFETFAALSLYESLEYATRQFSLLDAADGYVFGFMDEVFDFSHKPKAGKIQFLEHWEKVQDSRSVQTSTSKAVQIMTIHKAKGLEFPVVIFPYADMKLRAERNARMWFPLEPSIEEFDEVLVNVNKEVANFGDKGATLYRERQHITELDTINLLYVALTRPEERLYILAKMPTTNTDTPGSYNELFRSYLQHLQLWPAESMSYEFGTPSAPISIKSDKAPAKQIEAQFDGSSPDEHNIVIAGQRDISAASVEAIALGNHLHTVMSNIVVAEDIPSALDELKTLQGMQPDTLKVLSTMVTNITEHPELRHLFQPGSDVQNERDIVTAKGELLRPDRLNFWTDKSVSVVDYKTGGVDPGYVAQIKRYAKALLDMGFRIREALLIYCDKTEIIVNKV